MTPQQAIDLLAKYAYRCAEYDSMLRHRDAEAAIKRKTDEAVAVLRHALAERPAYYVTNAAGQRVPLVKALVETLAELGIVTDGGK